MRRDLKVAAALGSFTAIGVLLAGIPLAHAQTAPGQFGPAGAGDSGDAGQSGAGSGSFPGSFLIPGTNTSLKIGGLAKLAIIYDMSAPPANSATLSESTPDTTAIEFIPLEGTPAHQLHGALELNPRQSNFNFDVRTPTGYGELDTFVMVDFYGRNNPSDETSFKVTANPETARLVLAYGTLGPVLAGQMTSLWFDGDAMPETVDPSPTAGTMNILSNRQVQLRYTYAGANGLSIAGDIENPEAEVYSNVATNPTPPGFPAGTGAATNSLTAEALGGVNRVPDILARARIDQAWGHVALTGLYRDLMLIAPGAPRVQRDGYGGQLSFHLNTFGKDTWKAIFMGGQGIGHYDSDFINIGALDVGTVTGTTTPVGIARSYSANTSYTHWWTDRLRSTIDGGYARLNSDLNVITSAAAQNGLDKYHYEAVGNLIWSPVPQVDFGIEFDWAKRVTNAAIIGGYGDFGYENRIESMAAFKF